MVDVVGVMKGTGEEEEEDDDSDDIGREIRDLVLDCDERNVAVLSGKLVIFAPGKRNLPTPVSQQS